MKRCLIESLIGGMLAAIITYVYCNGNIPAVIGTIAVVVPAGYYGCCLMEARQRAHKA